MQVRNRPIRAPRPTCLASAMALAAGWILLSGRLAAQTYDVSTYGTWSPPNVAFGFSTAILGDIDGDGRDDFLVGDPWTGGYGHFYAGRIVLISGATGAEIRHHDGVSQSELGYSVARIGDLNADGAPEYAAGAPGTSPGGRVYVYSGSTGVVLFSMNGQAVAACGPLGCGTASDRLGESVAGPGDLDLDGIPDIAAGAPNATPCFTGSCPWRTGRISVYSGATGIALLHRGGSLNGGRYGRAVAPGGDVNGDGVGDILVGAPGSTTVSGYVEVVAGVTGTQIFSLPGPSVGSGFGSSLATLGDANLDGRAEFAIGAPNASPGGIVEAGAVSIHDGASGAAVLTLGVGATYAHLGGQIANAGDVDGDGYPEVAVSGVGWVSGSGTAGTSVRLFSPATAAILRTWTGPTTFDSFGASIAGPANLDGDSVPDLVVGAATIAYQSPPGYVRALSAAATPPLFTLTGTVDPFGSQVTDAVVMGDVNGDGTADFAWIAFNARLGIVSGATGSLLALFDLTIPSGNYFNGFHLAAIGDVDADQVPDVLVITPNSAPSVSRTFLVSGATGQIGYTVTHPICTGFLPAITAIGDQNADGVLDFALANPCSGGSGVPNIGEVYVHSGLTGSLLGTIAGATSGSSNYLVLASAGDENGDGLDDVVVGAPYAPTGLITAPGEISVFSAATGTLIRRIPGPGAPPSFGYSVSSMPDLDADGVRELVASSYVNAGTGGAWVHSGATGVLLHSIAAPASGLAFGVACAGLGDCDGDGVADLAVGAPGDVTPGHIGSVRIYSGSSGTPLATAVGETYPSEFGRVVASAGDLNHDGLGDLLIVAPWASATPRIRVISYAGVPSGSTAVGSGCPDALGRVPGLGAYGGEPDVTNGNASFGLLVSNIAPSSTPSLIFGFSSTSWNGYVLPLDLGQFGLSGCTLYTSLDVLVPLAANSAQPAAAAITLGVPVMPNVAGSSNSRSGVRPDHSRCVLPGCAQSRVELGGALSIRAARCSACLRGPPW